MSHKQIMFSVNEYDSDGDSTEVGVFLHFGDCRVKVTNSVKDFPAIVEQINQIAKELEERYGS